MDDLITELFLKCDKRVQYKLIFLMGICLFIGIINLFIHMIIVRK